MCCKVVLLRAQVSVYVSFYVEATNRDAYMAIKQDLLLAFIDCVERNGAKLAKQLLLVRPGPSWTFVDEPKQQSGPLHR